MEHVSQLYPYISWFILVKQIALKPFHSEVGSFPDNCKELPPSINKSCTLILRRNNFVNTILITYNFGALHYHLKSIFWDHELL